jgi:hypothetical protein
MDLSFGPQVGVDLGLEGIAAAKVVEVEVLRTVLVRNISCLFNIVKQLILEALFVGDLPFRIVPLILEEFSKSLVMNLI